VLKSTLVGLDKLVVEQTLKSSQLRKVVMLDLKDLERPVKDLRELWEVKNRESKR